MTCARCGREDVVVGHRLPVVRRGRWSAPTCSTRCCRCRPRRSTTSSTTGRADVPRLTVEPGSVGPSTEVDGERGARDVVLGRAVAGRRAGPVGESAVRSELVGDVDGFRPAPEPVDAAAPRRPRPGRPTPAGPPPRPCPAARRSRPPSRSGGPATTRRPCLAPAAAAPARRPGRGPGEATRPAPGCPPGVAARWARRRCRASRASRPAARPDPAATANPGARAAEPPPGPALVRARRGGRARRRAGRRPVAPGEPFAARPRRRVDGPSPVRPTGCSTGVVPEAQLEARGARSRRHRRGDEPAVGRCPAGARWRRSPWSPPCSSPTRSPRPSCRASTRRRPAVVVLTDRRVVVANDRRWAPDVRTFGLGAAAGGARLAGRPAGHARVRGRRRGRGGRRHQRSPARPGPRPAGAGPVRRRPAGRRIRRPEPRFGGAARSRYCERPTRTWLSW